ncbi:MAG: trypsin-like peptidase domain-containing protein [Planctomycetales bacterium]|nr:trypsin-like peptidase domain-containing protein [Planctomycetales bacterium]
MVTGRPLDTQRRTLVPLRSWDGSSHRSYVASWLLIFVVTLSFGNSTDAQETQTRPANTQSRASILKGNGTPSNLADLKTLQEQIQNISADLIAKTVAIQVGRANGSGVIVSENGYVLTAAHVAGEPDREAIVILADGEQVRGVTLGLNEVLDAGMIKLVDSRTWPHAELGESREVRAGQWCLATGHPGGYKVDRAPVLRMGRVIKVRDSAVITDCTLEGGDSGGPLFDVNGRVIAVHSRIGKNLAVNVHVPIERYRKSWDRLAKGEAWDRLNPLNEESWVGVFEHAESQGSIGVLVGRVVEESPAQLAGIQAGDELVEFAGIRIRSFDTLRQHVKLYEPGDSVKVQVSRDGQLLELDLKIGSRQERQIQR